MNARVPYEACPLCEGRELEARASAPRAPAQRWLRCKVCDHVFVESYPPEEALATLSPGAEPTPIEVERARQIAAVLVGRVVAVARAASGRWLDVGLGDGSRLATAAEFGWDVVGLDVHEDAVRRMRACGFDAHAADLSVYQPAAPFDVVSLNDGLDRAPFPRALLDRAREVLRDGGLLVLSMPNADALPRVLRGKVEPSAPPGSLHAFGRRRLYGLLEQHGFTPRSYGVTPGDGASMDVIAEKTPRPPSLPKTGVGSPLVRLNLGCGRSAMPGWLNVDSVDLPGVDLVADLEKASLPLANDSVSEIHASHFIEHVRNALGLLQELHRVAVDGALATFRCPYGSSDDAHDDPTHVRSYFYGAWGYFSQPYYWRADYGYRGDWEVEEVALIVDAAVAALPWQAAMAEVQGRRNVVKEMVAKLRAIKPIREPLRSLQKPALITFVAG